MRNDRCDRAPLEELTPATRNAAEAQPRQADNSFAVQSLCGAVDPSLACVSLDGSEQDLGALALVSPNSLPRSAAECEHVWHLHLDALIAIANLAQASSDSVTQELSEPQDLPHDLRVREGGLQGQQGLQIKRCQKEKHHEEEGHHHHQRKLQYKKSQKRQKYHHTYHTEDHKRDHKRKATTTTAPATTYRRTPGTAIWRMIVE